MHLSTTQSSMSTVHNSQQREAVRPLNFAAPAFPYSGITTAHPHPVAPFPPLPPSHSHSTLYPSSIPSSLLHRLPQQPQPFYSLAMTHLPPNLYPRPMTHTIPTTTHHHHTPQPHHIPQPHSLIHRPPSSSSGATRSLVYCTAQHTAVSNIIHSALSTTHSFTNPSPTTTASPVGSRGMVAQPIPLRQATIVGVTCNHCGNQLLVDISGHLHYRTHPFSYPFRPPMQIPSSSQPITSPAGGSRLPSLRGSSPIIWRSRLSPHGQPPRPHYNNNTPPLPWPPIPQTGGGSFPRVYNVISSASNQSTDNLPARCSHNHLSVETSSGRSSRPRTRRRYTITTKPSSSSSSSTSSSQTTQSRMIPYRRRKKHVMTTDVYARQQLELEFATDPKPTFTTMGQLAMKLGVTKEFVKQWFTTRRQRERMAASRSERNSESTGRRIPSVTHEITMEIPASEDVFHVDIDSEDGASSCSTTVIITTSE